MRNAGFALLAALGCALLGASWAMRLSGRVAALSAWARVLARLEGALANRAHTLAALLVYSVEGEEAGSVRRGIEETARRMREDALLPLDKALDAQCLKDLRPPDRSALSPLWSALGGGDEAAQRGLLQAVRGAVAVQLDEARAHAARDMRLAYQLGIIAGAAVFLFLL
ncbi:MAG: stage III sporulation protein AB [Oscillospiraceae bacterium]|nr:stage III sporulation protein AB [Oscillospiraceae bacterium]